MADESYVQLHVEAPDLEVGMHVEVNLRHSGEGTFTGTITEITNGAIAHIRPDSADVSLFLGGGDYTLGSAHWPSSVRVLDGKDDLTCPR